MPEIFLSYNREDQAAARRFARRLLKALQANMMPLADDEEDEVAV